MDPEGDDVSEQGSSAEGTGGAAADAVAKRARQRHARDKALVEAARGGDRTAFGKLYDEWVDSVYDRAVHAGASAAEAREVTEQTFLAVYRDLAKLKQPAAFGAKVLQVARRETAARVTSGEKIVPKSGPSAEDRLTRATSALDTASDPEAAAVLREAAHALDEQTRDILDLHFRLGLTKNEVAAVLGEEPAKVEQTITKLPPALAVLTRARVLWRGGSPDDDGLQEVLTTDGVTAFNASAVRTINRYAKDNDRARARSLMGIPPVELFAAIPLVDAPAGLKTAVSSLLVTESVPMDGSAFVKRDDKGEIVDAPKAPPAPDGSVRPGIENTRPRIDPQKAAAVAAAALAAERAADDRSAAEAAAADAAPAKNRRERKAEKADRSDAAAAATVAGAAGVAAATTAPVPPTDAPDLAARKSDTDVRSGSGSGSGSKAAVAGAAAAGAVLGTAGVAAATSGADAPAASGGTDVATADTDVDASPADASATGREAGAYGGGAKTATSTRSDAPDGDTKAAATTSPKAKTVAAAGAGAALGTGAGAKAAGAKAAGSTGDAATKTAAGSGTAGPRAGEAHVADGGSRKWIAIGVAAVILLGVVAFLATRGGDDQKVATSGSPGSTAVSTSSTTRASTSSTQSTTTLLPTTTVDPTATTVAPVETTVAPTPTTSGGGGNPPPTQAPPVVPTTEAPATTSTTAPPKVKFGFDPPNLVQVRNNYDPNADTSPKLSWSVEGDATVMVEGPNFSSSDKSATKRPVCPVELIAGRCTINSVVFPKEFSYRISVTQPGSSPQISQVTLYITE